MLFRAYGTGGPPVSVLAFGAMNIALDPALRNGVSGSLLHALERGVSLVDTARLYRNSEEIVGRTLRAWPGERPRVSTKLAPTNRDGFRFGGPIADFYRKADIIRSVDQSLTALGSERLDIVHLHQWHYRWTHELEWLEALRELRSEGKVGLIAVSGQDHEHDALLELVSRGLVDGVQVIVNLFESRPMNALLPRAAECGVGVIARCVLDSGGLTGALTDAKFEARPFLRHAPAALYRRRVAALSDQFVPASAASLTELAIRFVLSDPAVSSITLGLGSPSEVDAAIAAIEAGPLPTDAVAAIRRHHVWTKNFYEALV
jgi:aryl-alcohol dehydrogenase-like predicted oxidoreductase